MSPSRQELRKRVGEAADYLANPPEGPIATWRRLAWPVGIAAVLAARYSAESLRHRRFDRGGYELTEWEGEFEEVFRPAVEALLGPRAIDGNRAELLINGDEIFPAMLEAVRGAKETIHFETYVYWRGGIAREFAEAVSERAREGVTCRVILDAVGSAKMDQRLVWEMREAGVEVVRFRVPKPYMLGRVSKRTHRRILVVDGEVGFTGGVGIAEEWTGNARGPGEWRDTHARVEGPVIRDLQGAFAEHWLEMRGEALVGDANVPEAERFEDGAPMSVIRSGDRTGSTNAEMLYVLALSTANEEIEITSAYFAPRPPFVRAMCDAAERGVRVRVLVPGSHTDKELVRQAGRNVYEPLLECGIEIFEYQATMLHAKTMQIDGAWGAIGTLNFDNRSLKLNEEIALSAFDSELAEGLHRQFEEDLSSSERVEPERWGGRPWYLRAAEWATKPLRREM